MRKILLSLALAFATFTAGAADTTISGLPAGSAVTGPDLAPVSQSGTTNKVTAAQIATYTRSVTTQTDVGLGNVDNTSDATKNAAVATLTNKTLTAPVVNSPTGITATNVGLGNVDNTSDATKNAAAVTLTNKTITAPTVTLPLNSSAEPRWESYESDQASDEKFWDIDTQNKVTCLRTRTDLDAAGVNVICFTRGTGTALASMALGNGTSNQTGSWAGTGAFTFGGNLSAATVAPTGSAASGSGLFLPAASTLGLSTNGTAKVWIDTKTGVRKSGITLSATERAAIGGVIYQNITTTGNTAATETDAFSHTLTASTFGSDGESLEFEAAGTFAATASTDKRVKVVFGATTVFDTGTLATTAGTNWNIHGTIVRTGAATQKASVTFTSNFASAVSTSTYTTPAETLSGAITMKLTVNGTNANDSVAQFYKEKWFPFL